MYVETLLAEHNTQIQDNQCIFVIKLINNDTINLENYLALAD